MGKSAILVCLVSASCFQVIMESSMVTAETTVNRLILSYSSEFHRNLDS